MNAILLIKPQFVNEIIAGRKGYEFRKKGFKQYETPINPYDYIKGFHAPQSFCYTDRMPVGI